MFRYHDLINLDEREIEFWLEEAERAIAGEEFRMFNTQLHSGMHMDPKAIEAYREGLLRRCMTKEEWTEIEEKRGKEGRSMLQQKFGKGGKLTVGGKQKPKGNVRKK
jgi:hypothetical protein